MTAESRPPVERAQRQPRGSTVVTRFLRAPPAPGFGSRARPWRAGRFARQAPGTAYLDSNMLTIRQAQVDAMGALLRERFFRATLEHLRHAFPDRALALGDDGLRQLIDDATTRGKAAGIETEQDVAGLAHFMLATAPDFDTRPEYRWAAEIMRDPDLAGTDRIDALFEALAERSPGGGDLT